MQSSRHLIAELAGGFGQPLPQVAGIAAGAVQIEYASFPRKVQQNAYARDRGLRALPCRPLAWVQVEAAAFGKDLPRTRPAHAHRRAPLAHVGQKSAGDRQTFAEVISDEQPFVRAEPDDRAVPDADARIRRERQWRTQRRRGAFEKFSALRVAAKIDERQAAPRDQHETWCGRIRAIAARSAERCQRA